MKLCKMRRYIILRSYFDQIQYQNIYFYDLGVEGLYFYVLCIFMILDILYGYEKGKKNILLWYFV